MDCHRNRFADYYSGADDRVGQAAQKALDDQNSRKTEAQTQQDQYNKYVQDIKHEQETVAATKAKQTFVSNALTYNAAWPRTYSAMRDLTSPKVLLKSMYVSDDRTSINFTGFCQAEEDLVRWWMFLRSKTDLYSDVHFRLPEHPYPPKAEATTGGGGAGSMGAMGGSPGMLGGAGAPGMAGMGGSAGMAGSGGMGGSPGMGSFGGGGGSSNVVGDEEIEGRKGIGFSATATLKKPLAGGIPTPTWATAGGSSAGGGGGFGPMGGGMSGSGGPGAGFGMVTPPGGGSKGK